MSLNAAQRKCGENTAAPDCALRRPGYARIAAKGFVANAAHEGETMKRTLTSLAAGTIFISAASAQPAHAPTPDNHDKMAWELFVSATRPVTTPSGNRITFETWASNEDTFQQNPQFPGATAAPNCAAPQVATRELGATAQAPRAAAVA